MITVGIAEAKAHLSSLVDQAAAGGEIVITRKGVPIARVVGLTPEHLITSVVIEAGALPVQWTDAPVVEKPKPKPPAQRPGLTMADMVKLSRG